MTKVMLLALFKLRLNYIIPYLLNNMKLTKISFVFLGSMYVFLLVTDIYY